MANPSKKALSYIAAAEKMDWAALDELWHQIRHRKTPGWAPGKALEHLIVRAFRLSGLDAEYPYDVPTEGKLIEQIDGIVYMDALAFLIECKEQHSNAPAVIAKMRHQLERRPPTTFGCIFVTGTFTNAALFLTAMTPPQRILLWPGSDIAKALSEKDFASVLRDKYRHLCRFGMTDSLLFYSKFEEP